MKKLVSVARALKEKNRVAGKLAKLRDIIAEENSLEKKIPRNIDVKASLEEAKVYQDRLIAIKTAIAKANQAIVEKIIALDEIKSEISFFNNLNVKEGVFEENNYGSRIVREFEAVIRQSDVLAKVEALQKEADALQDELDEFNASKKIEIEID